MKSRTIYLISTIILAMGAAAVLLGALSASAAAVASSSVIWTDDFGSSSLDSHWSWLREDPTHWSLTTRPGFMQIMAKDIISGFLNTNILLQAAPPGDFEIETRLIFTPTENIQRAGLIISQDDTNLFMLLRAYCGYAPQCLGNGIYFDYVKDGQLIDGNFAMTTTVLSEAYLRLIRQGAVYTGYVSEDGTHWTLVGTHTVISGLVPTKVGLAADVVPLGAPEIPAYFDNFILTDHSQRLYLPLIAD